MVQLGRALKTGLDTHLLPKEPFSLSSPSLGPVWVLLEAGTTSPDH